MPVHNNKNKREVATLIPYKTSGQETCFFLQVRDHNAPRLPGFFGFFGGGLENDESPDEALVREIKDELGLTLTGEQRLFSRYEALTSINHVYIVDADERFDGNVTVYEGERGEFLSETQIKQEDKICDSDKLILTQLSKTLRGEFTW